MRHSTAVTALRGFPFRFVPAVNHFGDEFAILCAYVPLAEYEVVRLRHKGPDSIANYLEIADVLSELGAGVRFIALGLAMKESVEDSIKLKDVEINKLVYKYIGVEGGYLADFSYRSHHDFYIELDLDIDPSPLPGTTKERFIAILRRSSPE